MVHLTSWVVNGYENAGTAASVLAAELVSDDAGTPARGGDQLFCRVRGTDGDAESKPGDSAVVTLENSAPVGGAVTITPGTATEQDVLSCDAAGAVDPDGQQVLWTYSWSLVGGDGDKAVIPGAESDALTGADFERGDQVSCAATPTDGLAVGETLEAKNVVVIENSLPTIEAVSLTPTETTVFGSFECQYYGWSDADPGDLEEVAYTWLEVGDGGATTLLAGKVEATLPATSLEPGAVVRCRVTPKNGDALGAALESGDGAVVNGAPSIESVTLGPDSPLVDSVLVCDPQGYSDPEGGGPFYSYAWKKNNADLPGAETSTLSGAFDKGDVVRCVVTPSDGGADGAAVPSNEVLIGNTVPTIGAVTIEPAFGPPCVAFACQAQGVVEPNAAADVLFSYRWEVGDVPVDGATGASFDASALAPEDTVRCFATPSDGTQVDDGEGGLETVLGAEVGSNVATVVNTPPSVGAVTLGPESPSAADTVTCEPEDFDDPDCDPQPAYVWKWYVNGAELDGADGPQLSLSGVAGAGASVQCQAIPDDGYTLGTGQLSNTIQVVNQAPTDAVVVIEAPGGADGDLTCAFQVEPADADQLSYTWYWQVGDDAELVGEQVLPADLVQHCDLVACRVEVSDGALMTPSNTASLNLPLGDDCEDGNPCTSHACLPAGGCAASDNTADCDDEDPCTDGDVCSDGVCGGSPKDCDDGNMCTTDDCAAGTGCTHGYDGAACDDDNSCTLDVCDIGANSCSHIELSDGAACNADDDGCTVGDTCFAGYCIGGPPATCQGDPDPCKQQLCQSQSADAYVCATLFADEAVPCDDSLQCTSGDHCDGQGTCIGGGPLDCSIGAGPCQAGVCLEGEGCTFVDKADGSGCDADGDGCTEGDACLDGLCLVGAPVDCGGDSGGCVAATCVDMGGDAYACEETTVGSGVPCDDGDFFTVATACDGDGLCSGGEPRDCTAEVGDTCNTAWCDSVAGACVKKKKSDGTLCDDEDTCTVVDTCVNGFCLGEGFACGEEPLSAWHGGANRPTIGDLGFGRYVTQWDAAGAPHTAIRQSDAYGSREDEELIVSAAAAPAGNQSVTQWTTPIAVQPMGDFLVVSWFHSGCTCSGYAGCDCDFGRFQAWRYDYLGALVASNGQVEQYHHNVNGGTSNTYAGAANIDLSRAVPLAFGDGTWAVLKADQISSSGKNHTVTPAKGGIRYYPLSSSLVLGGVVELVPLANVPRVEAWDAIIEPSSGDILVVWASQGGEQLSLRRFSALGAPTLSEKVILPATSNHAIRRVDIEYVQETGQVLVAWDEDLADENGRGVEVAFVDVSGGSTTDPVLVNTTTAGDQRLGGVDVFADGGFVVVWDDPGGDIDGLAAKARLFDPTASPLGPEMILNTWMSGDQRNPEVAVLDANHWVAAFSDSSGKVWTRRFFQDGEPVVGRLEHQVAQTDAGDQAGPAGAVGPADAVLVAWESPFLGGTGSEILARLFDVTGAPMTPETQINVEDVDVQSQAAVAGGPAGYVVAWTSAGQDGDGAGVYARLVDGTGTPDGPEIPVAEVITGDQQTPAVALDPDTGSFLVAWAHDTGVEGVEIDVYARAFDAAGAPLGPQVLVPGLADGTQQSPDVTWVPDAQVWVVAWATDDSTANGWDVRARRVDAGGALLGEPAAIVGDVSGAQVLPALAAAAGGFMIACYQSVYSGVPNDYVVGCQRLKTGDLALVGPELVPHVVTDGQHGAPDVTYLSDDTFLVAWETQNVDGDGFAIQTQRYSPTGSALGNRIVSNRTWAADQRAPFVAAHATPAASFAVGWQSTGQDGDGQGTYLRVTPPE